MLIVALAGFVLGVCMLQAQSQLVPMAMLFATSLGGIAVFAAGTRSNHGLTAVALIACGALMAGFGYAGVRAQLRMAESLVQEHEGRDVQVTGVVASLPIRLERGVRFEFDVETRDVETSGEAVAPANAGASSSD